MNNIDMSFLYQNEFKETFFKVFLSETIEVEKKLVCKKGNILRSRFFYITEGTLTVKPKGSSSFSVSGGDLLYLPPDCVHTSVWKDEHRGYININFSICDNKGNQISFADKPCLFAKDADGTLYTYFRKIGDDWSAGGVGFRIKCKAEFLELLYTMTTNSLRAVHKHIADGILYLESHYLENTSIDEIAGMCNISPSTFRRLFKNYSDLSPIQYRNSLRIQKAKELLLSGNYNIQEVADAVNIPDAFYFSKLFKKKTGFSPSRYQKHKSNQ